MRRAYGWMDLDQSWILESESEQQTNWLSTQINADLLLFCQFCHGAKYPALITSTFSHYGPKVWISLPENLRAVICFQKESVTITPIRGDSRTS